MPAGDAAHMEKLRAGQERARLERERQARTILGENASKEQIDNWVKQALIEQRRATRLANEAKRSNKAAQKLMQQAAGAAPPPPPPAAPAATATMERPQHYPPPQPSVAPAIAPAAHSAAESLYEHSIFGGAVQPDRVQKVELERLQSSRPEHQVRGAAPGWLEEVDFELFSKGYVRAKHGGGRFRATAKDALDRVVAVKDFDIGGAAKPVDDEDGPAFARGRSAFQPEPETEAPPAWMRAFMSESQSRIERLETIISAKPANELSPEEKLNLWKREQEEKARVEEERRRRDREDEDRRRKEKEAEEDRRHERRMAELKAQVDADMARERERQKDTLAMFTQLMPKEQKSTGLEVIMPLLLKSMEQKDNTVSTIFGLVKGMAKGEESPRTWKDRILDLAEDNLKSAWDSGLITNILSGLKKPAAAEVPANSPAGMAFRLPDGRIVPPEVCADFVAKYQAKHGQPPSAEVCVTAFTTFMNAAQAAQVAAQQAPAQIAQHEAPQQAPMPGGTLPRTQEQAEEMVRLAGQKAAEAATAAGATPEQAQQAAIAAQRQLIDSFNARMAAPVPPAPPVPIPAAVQATPPPAPSPAALAAAQAAAPAPRPAPAPAALAAAQAASTPTATLVEQAPPPAAADLVMTPWMAKSFMTDAADAFQARQDAVDFLERSSRLGKISEDARRRVGEIYNDSEEDAPIADVLMAVKGELEKRGVPVPLSLVPIFMGDEHGAAWIESLLFACGCETFEQARKELREG